MVCGIERRPIFRENRCRDDFVRRLAALAEAGALTDYAWALLSNHAHLLIRTKKIPLARALPSLLTGYGGAFNLWANIGPSHETPETCLRYRS